LAVKTGEVAMPEVLVFTVAVIPPPANVPLAPEAGALNVTLAPEIALPLASVTVATNGLPKGWFTCALWPLPDVGVILAGGPTVFVRAKNAELVRPATVAVTSYGPPALALALKVGEVATPEEFVWTTAVS
jgi:hypothetical protein